VELRAAQRSGVERSTAARKGWLSGMDTKDGIREFLRRNFFVPGPLGDDESLLDQGIIDSTGVLEIVAFLETEFRLEVKDEEIVAANMDSVARLAAFVQRKLQPEGGRVSSVA
jgi:acyl carrier protein